MISSIRVQNFKAISDSGWIKLNRLNFVIVRIVQANHLLVRLFFAKNIFQFENYRDPNSKFPYHIPLEIENGHPEIFQVCHDGAKSFTLGFKLEKFAPNNLRNEDGTKGDVIKK